MTSAKSPALFGLILGLVLLMTFVALQSHVPMALPYADLLWPAFLVLWIFVWWRKPDDVPRVLAAILATATLLSWTADLARRSGRSHLDAALMLTNLALSLYGVSLLLRQNRSPQDGSVR